MDPWAVKRGQLPWKTDKGELNFVIDCRAVALGVRSARDHYFVNPIDSKFVRTIIEGEDEETGSISTWVMSGWANYKRNNYMGEHGRHPDGAWMFTGSINPERGVFEYSVSAARMVGISDEWSRVQLYDHIFDLLCEYARAIGMDLESAARGIRGFHVSVVSRKNKETRERITVYEGTGMIQFAQRWMLEGALNFPGIKVPSRSGRYSREFFLEPSFREFDIVSQLADRYEDDFTPRVDVTGDPNVFRDPSGRWDDPCSQWEPERYERLIGRSGGGVIIDHLLDPISRDEVSESRDEAMEAVDAPGMGYTPQGELREIPEESAPSDGEVSARGPPSVAEGTVVTAAEAIESQAKGMVIATAEEPGAPVEGAPACDSPDERIIRGTRMLASPAVSQDFRGRAGSPAWSGSISRGPISDHASWHVLNSLRRWMGSEMPNPETGEIEAQGDDRATSSRQGFSGTTVAWDANETSESRNAGPSGE